jgi:uncharacterized protein YggE
MPTLRPLLALLVLTTAGASAQGVPRGAAPATGGITVNGHATVLAAPDRARVTVTVFGTAAGGPAGGIALADALDDLVKAMRAAGIADARDVLPLGNVNARSVNPAVIGTVAKPTRERLEAIAKDVLRGVPDRDAPLLGNAQVQIVAIVDDCGPYEARAERAAFADARARAERLAAVAGLHLGAVTALGDLQTFPSPGCATSPDAVENGPNIPFGAPYGPIGVPVTVNETATFAIAAP